MGRKPKETKKLTSPATGENIAYSWLPPGAEVDSVLAGPGWKPQPGDVRQFQVIGFQEREGENGDYMILSCQDLSNGEQFTFAPGALFEYMVENDKIKTGDRIAMRFKGEKKLPNGFKANDWDILKLKKPGIHPDAPPVEKE